MISMVEDNQCPSKCALAFRRSSEMRTVTFPWPTRRQIGVASPPVASEERLLEYVDTFGQVATYKLEHGRSGEEDTVWVQMEDVAEWRSKHSTSQF